MKNSSKKGSADIKIASEQLREAAKARKCWGCNCLRSTLLTIDKAIPSEKQPPELQNATLEAKAKLLPPEIECRGCEVCFPALALNAIADITGPEALEAAVCPAEEVSCRDGWPPLAGNYTVLGFQRPVAICTLNSDDLWARIANTQNSSVAIVGTLNTENLGIERLIQNVATNPNIRFLIVCGEDSRQKIGHLPGQSLVALSKNGVGERFKIVGSQGKRPVLRNIEPRMVEHFRKTVEIIDMIGETSIEKIVSAVDSLAANYPGAAEPFRGVRTISVEMGYIPGSMVSDPNGFFVVYPDRKHGLISLEHFNNEGVLTTIIKGTTAAEVYHPVVEKKLLSRLDHACYLGRELTKAEHSLKTGAKYVQDAASEQSIENAGCGCAR